MPGIHSVLGIAADLANESVIVTAKAIRQFAKTQQIQESVTE